MFTINRSATLGWVLVMHDQEGKEVETLIFADYKNCLAHMKRMMEWLEN